MVSQNATGSPPPAQWENIVAAFGVFTFSTIALWAYISMLVSIGRNKKFNNSFYSLVFCLGISDCSMLILYLVYSVPCTLMQTHVLGETFDKAMGVLCNLTYFTSLPALASIAVNRYWAICRDESFGEVYSRNRTRLNIGLIWLIGLSASSFQIHPCCHLRYYYDIYSWGYDVTLSGFPFYSKWENAFVAGVSTIIILCYIPIGLKHHRTKRAMTLSKNRSRARQYKTELKMASQFLIIAVYSVIFTIIFTTLPLVTKYRWYLYISTILYIGNCANNPFVFITFSKIIRKEVCKLYGFEKDRRGPNAENKLSSTATSNADPGAIELFRVNNTVHK